MLQKSSSSKFVVLAVLDGWGVAPDGPGNAISQAMLPNFNKYWATYPHTQLEASGEAVGLPRGEVGNTETGHLNLGAGRIVYQNLARINMSIADGSFFNNHALLQAIEHTRKNNSKLHLLGLVGAGGVHSNIEHLFALIQLGARQKINNMYIHVFTDGRDSPPNAALAYISQLNQVIKREGVGIIASVSGRYWAMDRDQRWDRTAKVYFALTQGIGANAPSIEEAIDQSYKKQVSDEFIEPTVLVNKDGSPKALIGKNDSIIFFNFRTDRPRQLSRAFVIKDLASLYKNWGFDPYAVEYKKKHQPKTQLPPIVIHRGEKIKNLHFAMMTEYGKALVDSGAKVAFPPEHVPMTLGKVIANNNKKQLRVSESEKERFVTYYFNGQIRSPEVGEDRIVIPSPDVATYDLQPEMSAQEMTSQFIHKLKQFSIYSFALINYANPDMVGHTGNLNASIMAVEAVDKCIGDLANFVLSRGGTLIITADHGNVEEMINHQSGEVDTEHSSFPVPFIAISKQVSGKMITLPSGILADVAPTVLSLLDINIPQIMTGRNLLEGIV